MVASMTFPDNAPAPALPADPTLDEVRLALAPIIPHHAAFDGWSAAALASAAGEAGVVPSVAALAFDGPVAMIDAWFAAIDQAMAVALPRNGWQR